MEVEDKLSLHALNATKDRLMATEAAIAVEIGKRNAAAELKLMGKEDIRLMDILKKAEAVEAYAFHLEELRSRCMPKLEAANIQKILQTLKVTNGWSGNLKLYRGDTEIKFL